MFLNSAPFSAKFPGRIRPPAENPHAAPIRTASEMDARIVIPPLMQVPVHRRIARKVAELRHLDMTFAAIAKTLSVSKQTVIIAFRYDKDQNDRKPQVIHHDRPGA